MDLSFTQKKRIRTAEDLNKITKQVLKTNQKTILIHRIDILDPTLCLLKESRFR